MAKIAANQSSRAAGNRSGIMDEFKLLAALAQGKISQERLFLVLGTIIKESPEGAASWMSRLMSGIAALLSLASSVPDPERPKQFFYLSVDRIMRAVRAEKGALISFDTSLVPATALDMKPLDINTVRVVREKGETHLSGRILSLPVRSGRELFGVLQLLAPQGRSFDQGMVVLAEALATQLAGVVFNSWLAYQLEQHSKDETLAAATFNAMAVNSDLAQLLKQIIMLASNFLGADKSAFYIYDEYHDVLRAHATEDDINSQEIEIKPGTGLVGICHERACPIWSADVKRDKTFAPEIEEAQLGVAIKNALCVPVIGRDGCKLGVLQVVNRRRNVFQEADQARAQMLSNQISISLESAKLLEKTRITQQRSDRIIENLSSGLVALNRDLEIVRVNDRAIRQLQLIPSRKAFQPIIELNSALAGAIKRTERLSERVRIAGLNIMIGGEASFFANVTIVPITEAQGESIRFIILIDDISQEHRLKSTIERYLAKEVVERVLDAGEDTLGGTSQEVTVVFTDLRNFTSISEEMGARSTVSMLNDYFTIMVEVILNHHGLLDKYIGDAIMAVFGTPFPTPLDANNAVSAAGDMIVKLRELNADRIKKNRIPLRMGIGINTGEVITGNIGSPKRMDYTVIGDTVNLSSRAEGLTKQYGVDIIVSEMTYDSICFEAFMRELDFVQVKGRAKPISIYEHLSHHDEETFPNIKEVVDAYSKGLSSYRAQFWNEAERFFQAALDARPDDGPSAIMLNRCRLYIENPPSDDWNGVWQMKDK